MAKVLERLQDIEPCGDGWKASCPTHEDKAPSLSVRTREDGAVQLKCFAGCSNDVIVGAIGLQMRDLFPESSQQPRRKPNGTKRTKPSPAPRKPTIPKKGFPNEHAAVSNLRHRLGEVQGQWKYTDATGKAVAYAVRFSDKEPGSKTFRPVSFVEGQWRHCKLPGPHPLYQLPELLDPQRKNEPVFVVEGEKAADMGRSLNLPCTTSAGGSSGANSTDWSPLAGRNVVILPDNDEPGEKFAAEVTRLLQILNPPAVVRKLCLPNLPPKGDLVEYVGQLNGRSAEEIANGVRELVSQTELEPIHEPEQAAELQPLEEDDDPDRLAREYLRKYAADRGRLLVRSYHSDWIRYTGSHWRRMAEKELQIEVWRFCKEEFDNINLDEQEEGLSPKTLKVGRPLVGNVLAALESRVFLLPSIETGQHIEDSERRDWMAVRNGCLHVDDWLAGRDALHPHDSGWLNFSCLPYDYDPAAKCPKWLAFLDRVMEGDGDRESILQEFIGYCLLYDTSLQTMLLMQGDGSNGKSVFLAGAEAILGSANCSHLPLEMLGKDFVLLATAGKLVNLVEEVGEVDKVAEGVLKSIVGGGTITIDRKYQSTLEFHASARMVVACNNLPRFTDRTDGVWRRIQMVPFLAKIQPDERVLGMDKPDWWTATGELPGMLNWALEGLRRLRKTGRFTGSFVCDTAKARYKEECNPAETFLRGNYHEAPSGVVIKSDLYRRYREWSNAYGYRALSEGPLGKLLFQLFKKAETGQRRLGAGGQRVQVYTGIAEGDGETLDAEDVEVFQDF